ncbi:hypothetical protein JIN85_19980 [Luteolibacter pohnpeiensis]|uniref:Uncharacterized protein n=1 Tax=Luteolibacter pohnpeiensis TaxID=454153 RepID=A0A934SBW3_9BACT|nr:hypothetical protein [Luteolibacter pohnpeiensis]
MLPISFVLLHSSLLPQLFYGLRGIRSNSPKMKEAQQAAASDRDKPPV